jgi:hypothetical protein
MKSEIYGRLAFNYGNNHVNQMEVSNGDRRDEVTCRLSSMCETAEESAVT